MQNWSGRWCPSAMTQLILVLQAVNANISATGVLNPFFIIHFLIEFQSSQILGQDRTPHQPDGCFPSHGSQLVLGETLPQ